MARAAIAPLWPGGVAAAAGGPEHPDKSRFSGSGLVGGYRTAKWEGSPYDRCLGFIGGAPL